VREGGGGGQGGREGKGARARAPDPLLFSVLPGRCSEAERDRIEAAVGAGVRSASALVGALRDAAAAAATPSLTAHRAGVALALADRLAATSSVFDKARGGRYATAAAARAAKASPARRRPGAGAGALPPSPPGAPPPPAAVSTLTQEQARTHAHAALLAEVTGDAAAARAAEATARELAAINAVFSSHLAAQSDQIESLYDMALEAASHVGAGNVQLRKANAAAAPARAWVLYALLAAAAALLVADWLSS